MAKFPDYHPVGFYFNVTFTGVGEKDVDSRFQSVAGLNAEIQTETFREGGQNQFEHILPVRAKYSDLVLKRGLIKDSKLIEWATKTFETLIVEPKDLTINLLNESGSPLMTWNVVHAWPKKWSVSDLNAEKGELAIETLELHYYYFTVQAGS